ncbi:MAG: hypothetical protein ACOY40_16505 [Bacillota bacterium]
MTGKKPGGDKDSIPLSSYSPGPVRVKKPEIQTAPPENLSPHLFPSKETFPDADKKRL